MDKFVEFAPFIIIILLFLWQNRIFVTPEQLEKRFSSFEQHIEEKFVLQQTHEIAIKEIKEDIQSINEKLDKIYDILIKG